MYLVDMLPVIMFAFLTVMMFSGYPVAFVLGGTSLIFGFVGMYFEVFSFIEFYNIVARVWGSVAEKPILVAIPMFIFMGTMLEKSGIATDLLYTLQVLLRRVPGGLAIAVTVMGTIMAATTGIVGASVIMMTLLAMPVMLSRGYDPRLAAGTIAASGTLGILIPPSIMLVILADMLTLPVGTLFMAAVVPGLLLSSLYMVGILTTCIAKPELAPPLGDADRPHNKAEFTAMLLKSFIGPVFLIFLVLGSIFLGWATPTEAGGVGAFGAILLSAIKGNLSLPILKDVVRRFAGTNVMIFMIFIGATAFSYVFRALGGDDVIADFFDSLGIGPAGTIFLMMAAVFAMGFFFDWLEIILIVVPVFTPILENIDFSSHVPQADFLTWFAIIIAVNLQTSYLTPPFGYSLFFIKGGSPAGVTMQMIYKGCAPFVVLQLLGLITIVLYPQLSLWLPGLMSR
jgi:tripartite ATP-independent transporter DctM subunit